MHRNIRSRSFFLRAHLATIAIAIASLASLGQANSMDLTVFSEEVPDRIIPDEGMLLDALGYLGGLSEARFYQPHSMSDNPRDEIREAAYFLNS
jgi:hypothetical protein